MATWVDPRREQGVDDSANSTTAERKLVYCQSGEVASLLLGKTVPWIVAPQAETFSLKTKAPVVIVGSNAGIFSRQMRAAIERDQARLIYVCDVAPTVPVEASGVPIFSFLIGPLRGDALRNSIAAAFDDLALRRRQATLDQELRRARNEIDQLNEIGIALSTQHDRELLLNLILRKSCEITQSDAGSLYLVEEDDQGAKRLRFKITQNNSVKVSFNESVMPLDSSSVAGYVAVTGEEVQLADVYQIPPSYPFGFNRMFDEESGYRSRSMLAVPMKDPRGEVIGVVQLINCQREDQARRASS